MEGLLIGIYVFGIIASVIVAGANWDDGNKKLGARIGLLTPVWPVTAAIGLVMLAKLLWNHAGLEELRKD